MGFLIVQDIAVVLAMMVMGSTGIGIATHWASTQAIIASKVVLAVAAIALLMRYVLPYVLGRR